MILVIDTSTSQLSIGLATEEGSLLREFHANPDNETGGRAIHDALLAKEVAKLLSSESIPADAITRIGIIIGPGSFTGLRIGVSFAKGLAFAVGAEIVPITLHEALRAQVGDFDGLVVTPAYRTDLCYVMDTERQREIRLMTQPEFLKQLPRKILAHNSFLSSSLSFIPNDSSFAALSMATMAMLSSVSPTSIIGPDLDALEPLYLTEFNVGKR